MISILMPVYNGIEFIDESINSILTQTYTHWELIIAVNGHSENSEVYQIAKNYESKSIPNKIRVFDFHTIKGKCNTLNKMLQYCTYDHIALLDVDDIWLPNKLRIQIPFLDHYDVIGTRCIYFGDSNPIIPSIPVGNITNFDFSIVNPLISSSIIIKKEYCHWNSEYEGVEDYDLWLRIRMKNKRFYNCPEVAVKHRIHSKSAFNANGRNNKVAMQLSNMYKK